MEIAYCDEWANEIRAAGGTHQEVSQGIQTRARLKHPMYLGIVSTVNYNEKTDRYTIKFADLQSRESSAKVTNEVAEYLLTHGSGSGMKPTIFAHMTDGLIDSVLLLYLYRETR